MTDDSKPSVYTIDELWESQDFNHGHEFIDKTAYDALAVKLAEAQEQVSDCAALHQHSLQLRKERDALAAKLKEAEKEREMFIDRDRQSWEIRRDMSKEIKKLKDELTAERARSERLEQQATSLFDALNCAHVYVDKRENYRTEKVIQKALASWEQYRDAEHAKGEQI